MRIKNYEYNDGGRSEFFKGKREGDCVPRSIAIATGKSYQEVWQELHVIAYDSGYAYNTNKTYLEYLESIGWEEVKLPRNSFRMNEFPMPDDFVILYINSHLVAALDDTVYDIWDVRRNSTGNSPYVHRYYRKKKS